MTDTDEIQRSFPVNGPARLTLRNVDGTIDIAPGDADAGEISVRAIKHPGPGANQTEIEITQAADGRVSVITHYLEDVIARLFHPRHHGPARVDYTIRLPRACEVDVAFVSGQARLQGLAGQFAIRSVSGAIDLEDLAGRLSLNTVSGPITAAHLRLEDSLQLETVAGGVVVADSVVPAMAANTVSGQVRLQTGLSAGPYQLRSVSGDVWLAVPAGTACRVDMHSLSGRLRTGLPATRQAVDGGWTRMEFGAAEDAPQVLFNSVSGDLHLGTLDSAAEFAASTSAEAAPAASDDAPDRLALLDRVARGEITVDEAISTLKPDR